MRAEMERHKPPHGPLDVKLGPGGLVDLEFAVHVLQLTTHVGLDPRLEVALGAARSANALVQANIVDALKLLSRMLVMMRLVAPGRREADARNAGSWSRKPAARRAGTSCLPSTTRRGRAIAELWNSIKREA